MAGPFTLPDPLRAQITLQKTLSIYVTELQDCVNDKREQLGQVSLTFVNQKVGKTMRLKAIEDLKTLVNQLAIDFGFSGGVSNPELLGRPYVNHPKVGGNPVTGFPIINDLRRVLEKLISVRPPGVVIQSENNWTNFDKVVVDEFEVGTVPKGPSFLTGPSVGFGKMTLFNLDEIIEVKAATLPDPAGLESYIINRFDGGSNEKQLQTTDIKNPIDIAADDEFIYYLTSNNDGLTEITRFLKNDRTTAVNTFIITPSRASPTPLCDDFWPPYFKFSYMTIDETTIYLFGRQTFDSVCTFQGTNWHGPVRHEPDTATPYDLFWPAIAKVNKSTGSTSIKVFDDTKENFFGEDTNETFWRADSTSQSEFIGGAAVDGESLYAVVDMDERWRQLIAGVKNFDYIGPDDPETYAPLPIPGFNVWAQVSGRDETLQKYFCNQLRRVGASWIAVINTIYENRRTPRAAYVVKINKSDLTWTVLEPNGLMISSTNTGLAVVDDELHMHFSFFVPPLTGGTVFRVIDKNTGELLSVENFGPFGTGGEIASVNTYTITNPELNNPFLIDLSPKRGAINVAQSITIKASVVDDTAVDLNTIKMFVNAVEVTPVITPVTNGFELVHSGGNFTLGSTVTVNIQARDSAGNRLDDTYTFTILS